MIIIKMLEYYYLSISDIKFIKTSSIILLLISDFPNWYLIFLFFHITLSINKHCSFRGEHLTLDLARMFTKFILSLLFLISIASCDKFRFDNYTLYKILPQNVHQIQILQDVRNNDLRYDFWSEPAASLGYVSVMSSPQDKKDLENLLNRNQIKFEVKNNNIQEWVHH